MAFGMSLENTSVLYRQRMPTVPPCYAFAQGAKEIGIPMGNDICIEEKNRLASWLYV